MDLATAAERKADKARELPSFRDLPLPGVREKIARLLSLIGRVEGLFATYSVHDISHIDSMLKILDWLVPPATQDRMTPTDWLLVVLAIYLHDLGMLATSAEFENRESNTAFCTWFASLPKTTDGQEFISRAGRMTEIERERFFFQEFIRKTHAARIRTWITGRDAPSWGRKLLLLPDRSRSYLSPFHRAFENPSALSAKVTTQTILSAETSRFSRCTGTSLTKQRTCSMPQFSFAPRTSSTSLVIAPRQKRIKLSVSQILRAWKSG